MKIKSFYKFLSPKYQSLDMEYRVSFKPRYGHGKPAHSLLYSIIDQYRADYISMIDYILTLREELWEIKDFKVETDLLKPSWNNGFLPGLDIIGIYAMLLKYKPKTYVEVGSGNSTKVAFYAKLKKGLTTEIISIDPMPRAEIDDLSDTIKREPFEDSNFDFLFDLEENDILFIDNSHRILPNSDSMVFFMEVLPRLKPGVIVHIHDIYLPYDYPQFMCDRFYSEQYGLAMNLMANPKRFAVLLPNYFLFKDKELSKKISPLWEHSNLNNVERHGGSFWFRVLES